MTTMRNDSSLVEQLSPVAFQPTVERLLHAIERAGLRLFVEIDHAALARDAGLAMPPTTVLIYGSPRGGTPIMLGQPHSALDLPLRVLIREDDPGATIVSFHPVVDMLRRAGVPPEQAERLVPAQRILAEALRL